MASDNGKDCPTMLGEFEIIRRYFKNNSIDKSVLLGIGDDAAIVNISNAGNLVVTTDLLLAGRHFPENISARSIGHRVLAVSLSDFAAMSATPRWALLQLSLLQPDETWLTEFSEGLFSLANLHGVTLIGGDTVRGALAAGVTLLGEVENPVTRSGSQPGDVICVSGSVGDALLGLRVMQGKLKDAMYPQAREKFLYPEPRVQLGLALAKLATAMIDTSDGMLADLEKLITSSRLGAIVDINAIPLSSEASIALTSGIERSELLNGGDDYELCFTVSKQNLEKVLTVAGELGVPVTPIGQTCAAESLTYTFNGEPWLPGTTGFDHFRGEMNASET